MSQYLLRRPYRPRLPDALRDGGKVALGWIDDDSLERMARGWRFTCSDGDSSIVGCMGDHQELPQMIVVSVSLDLRRLPLTWRLLASDVVGRRPAIAGGRRDIAAQPGLLTRPLCRPSVGQH